jgi:DnaJ family protein B protein 11
MSENYYTTLGVSETASKDEIKKAYRGLQMKYHPDKNPGNQEAHKMTQKINEAYETLGDEQKRQNYDMEKNNPFMRMNAHGSNMDVPINDIFNMMFGGGGGNNPFAPFGGPGIPHMGGMPGMPGMPPGARVHIFHGGPMGFQQAINKPVPIVKSLQITMSHVLNGISLPLEIERWIMENGNKVFEKETIYVEVPKGIDDKEMIVLRDRGNVINDQSKGDIKITILVQNNTQFKRSGLDLILVKTISLKEALCGFSFELEHLNGKSYTLNNGKGNVVPFGYSKTYNNMGITRGDHTGNMIINFNIQFPEKLTEEQICGLNSLL